MNKNSCQYLFLTSVVFLGACSTQQPIQEEPPVVDTPPAVVSQQPYQNEINFVPGRVEIENYDEGGEGVSFHDMTTNPDGQGGSADCSRGDNVYITERGPDTAGECVVAWTEAGEWLEYSVLVEMAGSYKVTFSVANGFDGEPGAARGAFKLQRVSSSGFVEDLTPEIAVPATGGWHQYREIFFDGLELDEGIQIFRLMFTSNGGPGVNTPGNMDYMQFDLGK